VEGGVVNPLPDDTPVHRIGGGSPDNLRLKPAEEVGDPPGISSLLGGTPEAAARTMGKRFPRMAPKGQTVVGSSTAGRIRKAGFDVIPDPTKHFPTHGSIIHPEGATGFNDENLGRLSDAFDNVEGL